MREYETTFIIQPEISDEGISQLHERIDGLLERQKATRLLYDDMGRRKLAYDIRKFQKGHYWTVFYLDNGAAVPELERMLRLEDSVLRYLTVLGNEEVSDVEARKAEAAEQERIRAEKAAERAAREAEEAAAAAAAGAAAAAAAEEARASEAAEAAEAAEAPEDPEEESSDDSGDEAEEED